MANFTKQAIETAFLQLLNEKPLNKISVRDIVEKCGINRNSFYYHFQDIPSLIAEIITSYTDQLIEEYPTISTLDECCEMAFRYALQNRSAVMSIAILEALTGCHFVRFFRISDMHDGTYFCF